MRRFFQECWRGRSLLAALVTRQVATRYRGSVLGFFWSLLNPLILVVVYTLVFHFYMATSTGGHYSLFVLTGLLPWLWFTSGLVEGTASLASSGHLVTKSLFPPQLLPLAAVLSTMVHFLLAVPVLLAALVILGDGVPGAVVLLPGVMVLQALLMTGIVLGFAALNVRFRDVQHVLSHGLTLLFFLSPIVYAPTVVPERFRWTLEVNPVAQLVMLYHGMFLDGSVAWESMATVAGVAVAFLLVGIWLFERERERFAELL